MIKTKIEWCDSTWNPITGCLHGCEYCYARKIAKRFGKNYPDYSAYHNDNPKLHILDNPIDETPYPFGFDPTFHYYRLKDYQNKKRPRNIFVCSMADLFGEWVPDDWIKEIFDACNKAPQHNYMFLTKNPKRYNKVGVPSAPNLWYGTSITRENEMGRMKDLPLHKSTFVSFEPLLEDVCPEWEIFKHLGWIIIGAQTGKRKDNIAPDAEWIDKLVRQADMARIPVFMKDSLIPIVGEKNMRREFP